MKISSQRISNFQEMKGKFPEVIYKYREWKDENHKRVITNQELFYSPPSWFKDPNDCKGEVRYDLLNNAEKIKFIEHKLKENYKGKTRSYYRFESREIFKNSPLKNNNKIKELSKETFEEFDARSGVLSLTPNSKIMEMWEDYADGHKGFCIGYYSAELFEQLEGSGCKVFYEKELPIIYPAPKHSYEEQYIYQIYFKEDKYLVEDEYRTHIFKYIPLSLEDRIVKVYPKAFKEIILGARLSLEEKKEIISSIPSSLNHIHIFESEIVNGKIEIKNYC